MSEHEVCYFRPILDKKYPPEDKELPDPSGSLSKRRQFTQLPAVMLK